jgi:hypothetical protein
VATSPNGKKNPQAFANFNIEHVNRIIAATGLDVAPDPEALLADLIDSFAKYSKAVSSGAFKKKRQFALRSKRPTKWELSARHILSRRRSKKQKNKNIPM